MNCEISKIWITDVSLPKKGVTHMWTSGFGFFFWKFTMIYRIFVFWVGQEQPLLFEQSIFACGYEIRPMWEVHIPPMWMTWDALKKNSEIRTIFLILTVGWYVASATLFTLLQFPTHRKGTTVLTSFNKALWININIIWINSVTLHNELFL